MQTIEEALREFHGRFGLHIAKRPIGFTFEEDEEYGDLFNLRMALVKEEIEEYWKAYEGEDLVELADAICDLVYVLVGTAVSFGIPFDKCFAEVHRSNMSKANPDGSVNRREDGKILKSDQFSPPDLRKIIYEPQES